MINVASWLPPETKTPTERSTELRRTARANVRVKIDIVSDHHFWSGIGSNMSEGGVFIATHHVVPIGSRLRVQFGIDDGGDPIVALTEVRWVRVFSADSAPPGLGLRFIDLDPSALRRIAAFVQRRPSLLFED